MNAAQHDRDDPIAHFRERFRLPDGVIYLDGNSLGALPVQTIERQRDAVERQWGEALVRSWNDADWIGAPQRIGAKIASLIGAKLHEVIVADSTSVNLFKLIVAVSSLSPDRNTILTEPGNFPTDLQIANGAAATIGRQVRMATDITAAIDGDTSLIVLTHVHYKSGYRHDMARLTAAAKMQGVPTIWDLSHSVGAVPLDLNGDGVELAVGCGYKYLNGGPGAPAFLYVAEHLQERLVSPLTGWMGHAAPFAFGDDYVPAAGVGRFLCGTPPVLSLLALESGVDLFGEVDQAALFAKSVALFDLFAGRMAERCPGIELVTPTDPARRGSHISYRHPDAQPIMQALIANGVIGDFRAPDILRFGLTPLYVRFADVARAVDMVAATVTEQRWRAPAFNRFGKVT